MTVDYIKVLGEAEYDPSGVIPRADYCTIILLRTEDRDGLMLKIEEYV